MSVLITGAARGIGYALAKEFARHQHDLVLVDKNSEMFGVAQHIALKFNIRTETVITDLTLPNAPLDLYNLCKKLEDYFSPINILVNNAGIGQTPNDFANLDYNAVGAIIDLNMRALALLSHLYLNDWLKRKNPGKILNLSSTSAFQPMPFMPVYAASKAFVLNLSEALNFSDQLRSAGISITALCPGPTRTPAWEESGSDNSRLFHFMKPVPVEVVAQVAYHGLMTGKKIVIPGWRHRFMAFLARCDGHNLLASKVTAWLQKAKKPSS